MGHRDERVVVVQWLVQLDAEVLVATCCEVLRGAAHGLEDCAVEQAGVVNGHEATLCEFDVVDDDVLALGVLSAEGDAGGDSHVSVVHDNLAARGVGTVRLPVRGDERVRAVTVSVLVGHRVERATLDALIERDFDVLVGAGFEIGTRARDTAQGCPLGERAIVDGDEATVGKGHLVDDDCLAAGGGVLEGYVRLVLVCRYWSCERASPDGECRRDEQCAHRQYVCVLAHIMVEERYLKEDFPNSDRTLTQFRSQFDPRVVILRPRGRFGVAVARREEQYIKDGETRTSPRAVSPR